MKCFKIDTYRMHIFIFGSRLLEITIRRLVSSQATQTAHQQGLRRITISLIVPQCIAQFQILIAGHATFHILFEKYE